MIAEIGHFALILALCVAVVQASLPLIGAERRHYPWMALARPTAVVQFILVMVAFLCLTHAFVTSDFSVVNVVKNSHTAKPLIYKISGVWGNHEGSLLLWVLILAVFGAAVAVFGGNLPPSLKARVLSVQAMIAVGFYLFMLLTSNPFERVSPPPFNGQGLNPLLQDPGLAFHPPMLYLGYVGFSMAFSFAIAALIRGPRRRRLGALGAALDAGRLVLPHRRHRAGFVGGPTMSWVGAVGGSGIRSRTPRSCLGSPARRCCIRPRWSRSAIR